MLSHWPRWFLHYAAPYLPLAAQMAAPPKPCPKVLSILPTGRGDLLWSAPAVGEDTRERFELRECGVLQVYAFERGHGKPALQTDTGYGYPPYLFHFSNVLILQAAGGSSDHVFVFQFQRGKPRLVLRMATKDMATVWVDPAARKVTVSVPPTTHPTEAERAPIAPKMLVLDLE